MVNLVVCCTGCVIFEGVGVRVGDTWGELVLLEGGVISIGVRTENTLSKETKRNLEMVETCIGFLYIKSKQTLKIYLL